MRIVPISKELQPIVMDLFEQAEEGTVDMVPLAKQSAPRLYQRFGRIVDRAGLTRWPRLLQNLRSSCATDWASDYPVHESSKWMGQSVTIASKHYLQSQDLHFKAVTGSGPWVTSSTKERGAKSDALEVQNRVQRLSAPKSTDEQAHHATPETQQGCAESRDSAQPCAFNLSGRYWIRTSDPTRVMRVL